MSPIKGEDGSWRPPKRCEDTARQPVRLIKTQRNGIYSMSINVVSVCGLAGVKPDPRYVQGQKEQEERDTKGAFIPTSFGPDFHIFPFEPNLQL